jgi:hypothetical protein
LLNPGAEVPTVSSSPIRRSKIHAVVSAQLVAVLLLAARPARAAGPVLLKGDHIVVLGAGGDTQLPPDEQASVIVVLGGRAHLRGVVETLLVLGGDAVLDGASVRDLTVMGGRAELRHRTVVSGNVLLVGSELERDPEVQVIGTITRDTMPRWGSFPFGLLFALSASLAVLLAGLALLGLAPGPVDRAVALLGERSGATLIAGALVWIGGPVVGVVCMFSLIGLPVGIGLLVFVLPALAFVGYLVAGHATGLRVLALLHVHEPERSGAMAMVLGLVTLMMLGALPVVGAFLGLLAAFLGSGAIARRAGAALRARRRARRAGGETPVAAVPPIGAERKPT